MFNDTTHIHTQKTFSESLAQPELLISDFGKWDRPGQLHVAYQALHQYCKEAGQLPRPYNKEDAARVVAIAKDINDKASSKVTMAALCNQYLLMCVSEIFMSLADKQTWNLNFVRVPKFLMYLTSSGCLCIRGDPFQVELDERLLVKVAYIASGDVCPMQAVIGSISAQEVIKVSGCNLGRSWPYSNDDIISLTCWLEVKH